MTSYKLKLLQFFSSSHRKFSLLTIEPFISKSCFIFHAKFQIFKIFYFKRCKAGLIVYIYRKKGGHIFDVTCNVIATTLAYVHVIVMCSTNTAFENKTSLRHSVQENEAKRNFNNSRIQSLSTSTLINLHLYIK